MAVVERNNPTNGRRCFGEEGGQVRVDGKRPELRAATLRQGGDSMAPGANGVLSTPVHLLVADTALPTVPTGTGSSGHDHQAISLWEDLSSRSSNKGVADRDALCLFESAGSIKLRFDWEE
jgi:hypothetical protein